MRLNAGRKKQGEMKTSSGTKIQNDLLVQACLRAPPMTVVADKVKLAILLHVTTIQLGRVPFLLSSILDKI